MAYRYPSDIAEQSGDYVVFSFYDYIPPFKADAGDAAAQGTAASYLTEYNASVSPLISISDGSSAAGSNYKKADGFTDIVMYMPDDIATNYSQNWSGREFHPIAAGALGTSGQFFGKYGSVHNLGDAMRAGTQGVSDMMKSITSKATNSLSGSMQYMTAGLIAQGLNKSGFAGGVSPNDVLASQGGHILNPNTEVLYQGPQLRTFAFNFKMSARNSTESLDIRKICNTFKKASLPIAEGSGQANLIGVPRIVIFQFKSKGVDNKWLPKFKPCAIGSVNVNYTPNGVWSTFDDGSPVAVNLQIQLQELKIIFSSEIGDDTQYNKYTDPMLTEKISIRGGY